MRDVAFLAIVVAFFVVAVALVIGCDRIIGPDPSAPAPRDESPERAGP